MKSTNTKSAKRIRRHKRVRSKVVGTGARPRLSVFRSNRYIQAQLIDDEQGVTIAVAHDFKDTSGTKVERARRVGEALAKSAKAQKVDTVVFDRGGYVFTGRVKALAEAAREGGLSF